MHSRKASRKKKQSKTSFAVAYSAMVLMLLGCNSGSDNPLPAGAQISISPANVTFDIDQELDDDGNCIYDFNRYIDQYTVISVRNSSGSPIGDADLSVQLDFGDNSFSGVPVMELYEDANGNGVVDGIGELRSGADDPLYRAQTDEFSGEAVVIVRLNVSCPYRGSMRVSSDGFQGETTYDISSS